MALLNFRQGFPIPGLQVLFRRQGGLNVRKTRFLGPHVNSYEYDLRCYPWTLIAKTQT